MITFDCPFCDQPVRVESQADEARCDECSVVLEFASEPMPADVARAA